MRSLRRPLLRLVTLALALLVFGQFCTALFPIDAQSVTDRAALWATATTRYDFRLTRQRGETLDMVSGSIDGPRSWFVYRRAGITPLAMRARADGGWEQRAQGMLGWVPASVDLATILGGEQPMEFSRRMLRRAREPRPDGPLAIRARVGCAELDPAEASVLLDQLTGRDCTLLYSVSSEYRLRSLTLSVPPASETEAVLQLTLELWDVDTRPGLDQALDAALRSGPEAALRVRP